MDQAVEIFKSNLILGTDVTPYLKVKALPYYQKTIRKPLLDEYKADGWTDFKEQKRSYVIRKAKQHSAAFEDRVWSFLARLDFDYLNGPELKLIYSPEERVPGRKLDVFACDKDTVIIVECKSAEQRRKRDLQGIINDFITVKNGSHRFLKEAFPERKPKFVLATNNLIVSDNDRERLRAQKVELLTEDDIAYYESLSERIGKASKYQLLGRLFKNQEIPLLENKVPAIRGKMGGYTYYSFSIEPETLLKIGYILHRTDTTGSNEGYQRMVTRKRLNEIEAFLTDEDNPGFFPNSIIINVSTSKEDPLNYTQLRGEKHNSRVSEPVILTLPKKYHSAFIIDGQHRLYGYANTEWKDKNTIPVVAFENLPPEKQVELFVQINSKQKPVPKNLLITIVADLMWDSDIPKDAITSVKSKLLQRLGERNDSPLYKRIIIGERTKTTKTNISLDYILSYAFDKSQYFPKYQKHKVVSLGHLWTDPGEAGYSGMLDRSYRFFKEIFEYVETKLPEQFELGGSEGGFIATNIGTLIIVRLVDDILTHQTVSEGLQPVKLLPKTLADSTFPLLSHVLEFIQQADHKKLKEIRSKGSSAAGIEHVIREFHQHLHSVDSQFNPPGLQQWIKDNSGQFNHEAKSLTEDLELSIRENVFSLLKSEFHARWWVDGVPVEIRKKAAVIAIDAGSGEPDENFIYLLDYKKIAEKNWPLFQSLFADPSQQGKERQVKWFDQLNEIRNKLAHPGRAGVSEKEIEFLKLLHKWLRPRLQNQNELLLEEAASAQG